MPGSCAHRACTVSGTAAAAVNTFQPKRFIASSVSGCRAKRSRRYKIASRGPSQNTWPTLLLEGWAMRFLLVTWLTPRRSDLLPAEHQPHGDGQEGGRAAGLDAHVARLSESVHRPAEAEQHAPAKPEGNR